MPALHRRWLLAFAALLLAFGFLGKRGLWDPDEGRYSNVALNMLDSGDWLNPRRTYEVGHWTKPPLTYWAVAASVGAFGPKPWAARLPSALAYLLSAWLLWCIARRLLPGQEDVAALVFITMLVPFAASQLITTDSLLMMFETLAMLGYVEARFGPARRARLAGWVMWAGFALAFLTKGPPALLPLLAMVGFDRATRDAARHRVFDFAGLAVFLLLAAPWYIAVTANTPGLLGYFLGDEVVGRVASNEFDRNGQWYGWLLVYLPTLALGTLPWSRDLLAALRGVPENWARWRDEGRRREAAAWLLPWLWLALPLAVFCLSRSRLPLYVLPLFVPIALIVARQRHQAGQTWPRWPWLVAWVVLLLALKLLAAALPSHKDASAWARALRERNAGTIDRVIFVDDMARYGLHLHLGLSTQIEKIALKPSPQPRFNPVYDETLAIELAESTGDPRTIWITKQEQWPRLAAELRARGARGVPLGAPYQRRVIFRVERLHGAEPIH